MRSLITQLSNIQQHHYAKVIEDGILVISNAEFRTELLESRAKECDVADAEAIKKTYNDEKYLFRDNAKCTLYGTSNSVTALAYDDSNNVLHSGTSSGRSEFQGLVRINNTTTAVTTAISASNELVAEQ